jgi:hypothetical protein
MIVQPASLGPSGRPRRVLRLVGLVVPVVLLGAVVAAGVLAPSPAPAPSVVPVVAVGSPTIGPSTSPAPQAEPAVAIFPSSVAGLQVHGVRWTLEARNRGIARGVVAVAGYLGLDSIPDACADDARLGIFGPFCDRIAVLAEDPWDGATHDAPDVAGFHLHPQFPVGVRMPSQATNVALSPSTSSPAVVVLGRFSDPRASPCEPGGRHCGLELVVEQVAWVDGAEYPATPAVDPLVDGPAGTIASLRGAATNAERFLEPGAYPLLTALVDPRTIAANEPAATDAAARLTEPVWLIRALHETGDPSHIDWLIVARDGSVVLDAGSTGTTPFPGIADAHDPDAGD